MLGTLNGTVAYGHVLSTTGPERRLHTSLLFGSASYGRVRKVLLAKRPDMGIVCRETLAPSRCTRQGDTPRHEAGWAGCTSVESWEGERVSPNA